MTWLASVGEGAEAGAADSALTDAAASAATDSAVTDAATTGAASDAGSAAASDAGAGLEPKEMPADVSTSDSIHNILSGVHKAQNDYGWIGQGDGGGRSPTDTSPGETPGPGLNTMSASPQYNSLMSYLRNRGK